VNLAVTLQRTVNDRDQRIVVVGSGAFLANVYSGNGGNLDLGINMVNWLADEEQLITVQPHAAKDGKITLSRNQLSILSLSLLVLLPLLFAAVGVLQWWRRKRQGNA
jgi:ABC-type uncharacterized transport system involved in gliding motility auxiliary subunit